MPHLILLKPGEDGLALFETLRRTAHPEKKLHFWPAYRIEAPRNLSEVKDALYAEAEAGSLIVLVSPIAVQMLASYGVTWPEGTVCATVGEGSAARIRAIWPDLEVKVPEGKVSSSGTEALLALFEREGYPKRVCICRAQSGRELLADTLSEHGVPVRILTCYLREDLVLGESERSWLAGLEEKAVLFITNSDAVRVLRDNLSEAVWVKTLQLPVVTIHGRIRDKLLAAGFSDVRVVEAEEASRFLTDLCSGRETLSLKS